jgi:hypothetical protein
MRSPPFAADRGYVTVNRMVAGSSPARGANCFDRSKSSASPQVSLLLSAANHRSRSRRDRCSAAQPRRNVAGPAQRGLGTICAVIGAGATRRFARRFLRRDHFRIVPRRLRLRAFWQWPTSSLRNSNATLGIGLFYIARMTACDRRKRRPALTIAAMCSSRASGRGVGRPRRPAPISRPS